MKLNENLEEYVKSQSELAFKKIVNEFTPLIYSACYRKLLDEDTAKDVTQQVFLIFHRKAKSLITHPNLSGWFYKVAINTAAKHLSKKSREVLRMQTFRDLSELGEETKKIWLEKIMPNLDDAVQELPEKLRSAIVEHYLVGNSISEASNKLEISEVAMRQRLSRGVRQLKDYFNSRGTVVSITVLTTILASPNLHAVPAGLNDTISQKTFETISQTHPIIQEILIMSAGTKLAIGGVIILVIGSLFLFNYENEKLKDPEISSLRQENQRSSVSKSSDTSTESRRISLQRNSVNSQEINNFVGSDLFKFLSVKYKEGINTDEWYDVLSQCGIQLPRDIYDDQIASCFPEKLLSTESFDKFLNEVIYHWTKSDHMAVADWLSQRKIIYVDFTKLAYRAVIEKNNDFMKGYNIENIIQFVEALPESEKKKELLKEIEKETSRKGQALDLCSPDLDETLKKLKSLESKKEQKRLIWSSVLRMIYNDDIDLLEKLIESSEEQKEDIHKVAIYHYFLKDPAKAIEWMKKMNIKPDQEDIGHISLKMSTVDFDLALDYLQQNSSAQNLTKNKIYLALNSRDYSPVKRSEIILTTIENGSNFKNLDDFSERGRKLNSEDQNRGYMHTAVKMISQDLAKRHPSEFINWTAELSQKKVINFNNNVDQIVRYWNWSKYSKEGLKEWAQKAELTHSAKSKFLTYIEKSVKD